MRTDELIHSFEGRPDTVPQLGFRSRFSVASAAQWSLAAILARASARIPAPSRLSSLFRACGIVELLAYAARRSRSSSVSSLASTAGSNTTIGFTCSSFGPGATGRRSSTGIAVSSESGELRRIVARGRSFERAALERHRRLVEIRAGQGASVRVRLDCRVCGHSGSPEVGFGSVPLRPGTVAVGSWRERLPVSPCSTSKLSPVRTVDASESPAR